MAEIGESSVDQVQPQTTQDIKQTNGTDFVNGMSSPDDLKVMEPYKTQADDEFTPKQSTNGEFGMDQDNPFGVQGHNQDLLSDTTDQQVPQNLDTFDTLPSDMGTSVDEPSQKTTGADGILIDFEGKEIPKPNTVPDVSSDSGVEEDKSARQSSASSQKKKYGIDAKNDSYKPGGGRVKIFDQKVQVKASSRVDVGSKTPPGGTKPVNGSPKKESPRPKPSTPKGSSPSVKNVSSRIGSLDNAKHTPGGGKVNIVTKKTDYSKVSSRVGSTANMDHRPGGGEKKIQSQKLDWKTGSRIGSLDNARHSPGGGNVKITDEKLNWSVSSRVGSLDNAKHSPGGGNVQIESRKVDFKDKAHSKVGSTDNMGHKPAGGTKRIETQKLDFKDKAKSRVDAKSDHKPAGGDKKIETQKLNFKETAKPKTDSGKGAQPRTESVTSQED